MLPEKTHQTFAIKYTYSNLNGVLLYPNAQNVAQSSFQNDAFQRRSHFRPRQCRYSVSKQHNAYNSNFNERLRNNYYYEYNNDPMCNQNHCVTGSN